MTTPVGVKGEFLQALIHKLEEHTERQQHRYAEGDDRAIRKVAKEILSLCHGRSFARSKLAIHAKKVVSASLEIANKRTVKEFEACQHSFMREWGDYSIAIQARIFQANPAAKKDLELIQRFVDDPILLAEQNRISTATLPTFEKVLNDCLTKAVNPMVKHLGKDHVMVKEYYQLRWHYFVTFLSEAKARHKDSLKKAYQLLNKEVEANGLLCDAAKTIQQKCR